MFAFNFLIFHEKDSCEIWNNFFKIYSATNLRLNLKQDLCGIVKMKGYCSDHSAVQMMRYLQFVQVPTFFFIYLFIFMFSFFF